VPWLLLHGTPLTPEIWDAVVPLLDGAAVAPQVAGALSQAGIAADIARQTDLIPPWHVVGHSFGGQVALELAIQRPDLVSELTLLCTRDTPYSPFAAAADDVAAGRSDIDDTLRRWFSPAELDDDGAGVRSARNALATADLVAWATALRSIATFDCSAATPSIRCPAVIVAAEHDRVSDPMTMEAMHRRLLGSEFVVLRNAWHMSVFTDLHRLVDVLKR
jgi:3-oxoadipate enol-lactonase